MKRRTFLAASVVAALLFPALPVTAQETIKIGLVTALSGQSPRARAALPRGLALAIAALHAQRGVLLSSQPGVTSESIRLPFPKQQPSGGGYR